MVRFHNVDGKRVQFTEKEETERDLEEKQNTLDKPMKIWVKTMKSSDEGLISRKLEDHIQHDHNGITNSLVLQKAYALKKQLRKGKPKTS